MKNNFKKVINIVLVCMIIVYPLLFIWQGLDFTDNGYCLVDYSQIFKNPISISMSFSVWLSNIIGGLWIKAFGALGLLGVRIGGVIIVLLTIFLVYKILSDHIEKTKLLILIFLTMVLCYNKGIIIIHYDNISAFFYALGIYLMYYGLKKDNNILIFFSGFTAVLNIFARVPNILQLFIVFGIFYFGIRKKIRLKKQMLYVLMFILGGITAFIIMVYIMKSLGHLNIFISSMKSIESMGKSSSESHGISNLIRKFYNDNFISLKYSLYIIGCLCAVYFVQLILNKLKCSKIISVIFSCIIIVYFTKYFSHRYDYRTLLCSFIGFSYLAIIYGLIKYRKNVEYCFTMFLSVFFLLGVSLGSDNGFYNTVYSFYMTLPIAFSLILGVFEEKQKRPEKVYYLCFVLIILSITFLRYNYNFTYRDSAKRSNIRYKVESKYLKGIFTNKERAEDVTGLLNAATRYIKPNDYLLAFSNIPMIHYLTDTKPYLYNSWPGLYTREQFEYLLEKAQNEYKKYPVVIKQKIITRSNDWPKDNIAANDEKDDLINNFLKNNNYKLMWSNRSFEIYSK